MRTSFLSRLSGDEQEQIETPSTDEPKNMIISRTHQFWPGTHRFFLKGKFITGPFRDTFIYYLFIFALFLHALLFVLVLIPEVSSNLHVYFLSIYGVFFVGSIVFYFLTALTEPGLLPTNKFLKVRATLNKEEHQMEKLSLLTQFLQGFYASVLNIYWQRKWDSTSKETFSQLGNNKIKLGDMAQNPEIIPEEAFDESLEGQSAISNHRDNAEYHDDILTYKSESIKVIEEQKELDNNNNNDNEESIKSIKNFNSPVKCMGHGTGHDTLKSGFSPCNANLHNNNINSNNGFKLEKNWLLEEYKSKFCLHCQIYKTKHAVHCDSCNSCVRVHNHHCVFVNNCIGKRNYKHFLALVTCLLFLNIYFMVAMFLAFPQLMLLDLTIFRSFVMLLFLQSVLISGYCVFHLFLFFSFLINGEDPSRIREHSPLRSFLFKRLRKLKSRVNKSIRRTSKGNNINQINV